MNGNRKSKRVACALGCLQAFIGLTAIAGGFRLVSNPNGMPDIPIEWLSNSPFTSYFIPGLVLLIVIGAGNVLASPITFLRRKTSGTIAILLGIFLVIYMTTEVLTIGLRNFLQPLYFILAVIVMLLGISLSKSYKTCTQPPNGTELGKLSTQIGYR